MLLNRATQGLYPPGSVFKIFTTLEYVHENSDYEDYSFDCNGKFTEGDSVIHCYKNKRHGQEDLIGSFADSCNSSFASLGLTLNPDSFTELCDSMLLIRAFHSGLNPQRAVSRWMRMQMCLRC